MRLFREGMALPPPDQPVACGWVEGRHWWWPSDWWSPAVADTVQMGCSAARR